MPRWLLRAFAEEAASCPCLALGGLAHDRDAAPGQDVILRQVAAEEVAWIAQQDSLPTEGVREFGEGRIHVRVGNRGVRY